jgi:hypothetical protein
MITRWHHLWISCQQSWWWRCCGGCPPLRWCGAQPFAGSGGTCGAGRGDWYPPPEHQQKSPVAQFALQTHRVEFGEGKPLDDDADWHKLTAEAIKAYHQLLQQQSWKGDRDQPVSNLAGELTDVANAWQVLNLAIYCGHNVIVERLVARRPIASMLSIGDLYSVIHAGNVRCMRLVAQARPIHWLETRNLLDEAIQKGTGDMFDQVVDLIPLPLRNVTRRQEGKREKRERIGSVLAQTYFRAFTLPDAFWQAGTRVTCLGSALVALPDSADSLVFRAVSLPRKPVIGHSPKVIV